MIINGQDMVICPGANFRGANLRDVNLLDADLRGANLRGADFRGAKFRRANFMDADLQGADFRGANLMYANFLYADLWGANLEGANFRGANLEGANFRGAKNIPAYVCAVTSILPAGDLTGWKKLADGTLCELFIPAYAKRSNATGRKCRAEYAIVVSGEGFSKYDSTFKYVPGCKVVPHEPFDDDRWKECASGIHFFITREEAEAYI